MNTVLFVTFTLLWTPFIDKTVSSKCISCIAIAFICKWWRNQRT
ncbi:hypothetical protein GLYMA_20G110850v4 [Glycine max]|nr:hypothetical protein GLYMA_20G110850v4 [Glycine max]KAH1035567.1 hypothetical protein GYH30_055513 [Glycine max]